METERGRSLPGGGNGEREHSSAEGLLSAQATSLYLLFKIEI